MHHDVFNNEIIVQKILIILGIVILVIGLLYPFIKKLGLGQWPGDVIF